MEKQKITQMKKKIIIGALIFMILFIFSGVVVQAMPMLVNQTNKIEKDYMPELVEYQNYLMHPNVVVGWERMVQDMNKQELYGLYIQSAYRDYNYQERLFNNNKNHHIWNGYTEHQATEMTCRAIAYPGTSEHQTGLAIDITTDGTLNQSFAQTTQGQWLQENCWNYGFIIRYPKDKTEITGIIFEPWHLRYIGIEHSLKMKELNFCLEEYIEYLNQEITNEQERYNDFKRMEHDKSHRCRIQQIRTLVQQKF